LRSRLLSITVTYMAYMNLYKLAKERNPRIGELERAGASIPAAELLKVGIHPIYECNCLGGITISVMNAYVDHDFTHIVCGECAS
jgi:hypothetical protein